jgi:hypothetical protein
MTCYTRNIYISIYRGIFVTERRSGISFSEGRKPESFFPAIDTRFGVSCYPTALLSNKLAQRPLKFQRVAANNSLDFVQFLKKKTPPPRPNFGSRDAFLNLFFFFRKIGLYCSRIRVESRSLNSSTVHIFRR